MMVLDPLEGKPCDFTAEDLFRVEKYHSGVFLKVKRESLFEKIHGYVDHIMEEYLYLLRGIKQDICWKVRRAVGDYQGDLFSSEKGLMAGCISARPGMGAVPDAITIWMPWKMQTVTDRIKK